MNESGLSLNKELAERVLYQGELRLSAQLQIALGADQRAITSASILIGIATAAFGFAGAMLPGTDSTIAISAALVGGLLLVAGGFCVWAAWPVPFRDMTARL